MELHFGFCAERGKRASMQDKIAVVNQGNVKVCGVFDGHGQDGDTVAQFVSLTLPHLLVDKVGVDGGCPSKRDVVDSFLMCDRNLKLVKPRLSVDSGTTAIVMMTCGSQIILANTGDSRAISFTREGILLDSTQDHNAYRNSAERDRIEELGGTITRDGYINGTLAVSRAFGDFSLKKYVPAIPDVTRVRQRPDFFLLASDGLWDYMDVKEIVPFVLNELRDHHGLERAACKLVNRALKDSHDNVTVMLVECR